MGVSRNPSDGAEARPGTRAANLLIRGYRQAWYSTGSLGAAVSVTG